MALPSLQKVLALSEGFSGCVKSNSSDANDFPGNTKSSFAFALCVDIRTEKCDK